MTNGIIQLKQSEVRGVARKKIGNGGEAYIEFEIDPRDRPFDMRAQDRIIYYHLHTLETQSKHFTGDEIRDILADNKEIKKKLMIRYHDVE